MATKTFYLRNVPVDGWESIIDGVTQTAATLPVGWTVSTGATLHSELQANTERAASTFVGTTVPDGTLDTTLKDAFRSVDALTGTFAAGNWTFNFVVIAVTNGGAQDGRIRFRLLKGPNIDGTGATEITAAQQSASIVTNVSTSADFNSSLTFNPGAITFNNEYLFVQVAWERTGAGGMSTSDILFRTGSSSTVGTRIVTTDFTTSVSGTQASTEGADTASASGTVTVTGTQASTEGDDTVSASGTVTVTGSQASTEGADTASASGTVQVTGTQASTEGNDTASASGEVSASNVTGSQASTEGDDSASASGTVTVLGSQASTEGNDTAAASGIVRVIGTQSSVEGNDTGAASGTVAQPVTGTSAIVENDDTASATGFVQIPQQPGSQGPWRELTGEYPKPRRRKQPRTLPWPAMPMPEPPKSRPRPLRLAVEAPFEAAIAGELAGPASRGTPDPDDLAIALLLGAG